MLSPPRSRKHGPEPAYSGSYDSGSHNSGSKVKETSIVRVIQLALLKWKLLGIQRKVLTFLVVIIIVFVSANIAQIPSSESYSRLSHPRLIQMKTDFTVKTSIDVEEFAAKTYSEKVPQPWLTGAEIEHGRENFEEKDCKAMHDWQVKSFPNCNNIHESDFLSYTHVNAGGWRDVWKAEDFNRDPYVVKSLIFQEDTEFRFRDAERHRRDANAYSMLHSSKHTMNIYGYCVNTATFDYSAGGDLEKMLGNDRLGNDHKLKYAWQFAKALSDVHSVGNIHDSAAISHADLSASQYLWFDGMFKLNDFNRARFIRWNTVKQEACPFYISYNPGLVSSTFIIFHDGVIFVSNNLKFLTMVTPAHLHELAKQLQEQ